MRSGFRSGRTRFDIAFAMNGAGRLAVVETHPVQYHAPVYRAIQQAHGIEVTAVYGSDFSVAGYRDPGFNAAVAWDTDLLSGYRSVFLTRAADGGPPNPDRLSATGLAEALCAANPSAVLVLGYGRRFDREAFRAGRRLKLPILFRGETTDHARRRTLFKSWIRDRALTWLYRRCGRILYIGRRSLEHYRRLNVPDDKLVFTPYCVDNAAFRAGEPDRDEMREKARREIGAGDEDVVVAFAGKLISLKGPDLLTHAARLLPEPVQRRLILLFVGSGEQRDRLEDEARRPPAIRAHFVGFQNQTRLSSWYHAADLLSLPSLHSETWGLVVNEALMHGVPCVVSQAVGCAPDLIDPGITGKVFDTGSAESLAQAILRALPLIGRLEVRTRCREKAAAYSVDAAADGLARAFFEATSLRLRAVQ